MERKLKQITDNIHGTIYLSPFESEMIATPYFYRLNDIYQSSTVYMTYPSNRTKRYEHSLGTMELSGSILYSSFLNTSQETRNAFMLKLKLYISQFFADITNGTITKFYRLSSLKEFIDAECQNNSLEKTFQSLKNCKEFQSPALDRYQYFSRPDIVGDESFFLDYFYYKILLQALRLVALFHDIGHPPFSHVIEQIITELSKENKSNWDDNKRDIFDSCMTCISSKGIAQDLTEIGITLNADAIVKKPIHERISIYFLLQATDMVFGILNERVKTLNIQPKQKAAFFFYYSAVIYLSLGIINDSNNFYKSIHKIVDGTLDADRFDYIVRDSRNTGVDWGVIPYKRLIDSAKLVQLNDSVFLVAYPSKLIDDIEDLIVTRYKIFLRINNHHRCKRTAAALQSATKNLCLAYLSKEEDDIVDISNLWTALSKQLGNKGARIIKWNDSWLITTLHTALIKLQERDDVAYSLLKQDLCEILLNKKSFISLFKRGYDLRIFLKDLRNEIGITDEIIDKQINKEYYLYYCGKNPQNAKENAHDSIQRLQAVKKAFSDGNIMLLTSAININSSVEELFRSVLEELKSDGKIKDYLVYGNEAIKKRGIPRYEDSDAFDRIYLYMDESYEEYNPSISLKPQIDALERSATSIFVFYSRVNDYAAEGNDEISVRDALKKRLAEELKKELESLFPSLELRR